MMGAFLIGGRIWNPWDYSDRPATTGISNFEKKNLIWFSRIFFWKITKNVTSGKLKSFEQSYLEKKIRNYWENPDSLTTEIIISSFVIFLYLSFMKNF